MKKRRGTLVVLLLIVIALSCGATRAADHRGPRRELLFNRIWVDHLPTSDTISSRSSSPSRSGPWGLQATSAWKGEFELFRYERAATASSSSCFPERERRRSPIAPAAAASATSSTAWRSPARPAHQRYFSKRGLEIDARSLDQARTVAVQAANPS